MPLRYASKNIGIPATGVTIPHGLGAVPDEFWLVQHGAQVPYLPAASAPDATNIYVTAGAAATASVFAVVNHSIIK